MASHLAAAAPAAIDLAAIAERPAPRYTSYPTAPHFAPTEDATLRRWLAETPAQARLGLYLHVPYCAEICWYCGCNTQASRRPEPIAAYAEGLCAEIDLWADAVAARVVREISWGGGTPNALAPKAIRAIGAKLAERFDLTGVVEHAVECDPRTLTAEHADAFAAIGVTRASLGAQDFNAHVQEAIGRTQPFDVVAAGAQRMRAAGVARLNLDLMYGLPRQSVEDAARSARLAASLAPDRIAAFGYAHVPWFKARQRLIDEAELPGARVRLMQSQAIADTLVAAGYVAIGFDHFARAGDPLATAQTEGRLSRSFQGYDATEADALLGVGASAISTLPGAYAQNAPEVRAWRRAVHEGRLPVVRGVALTRDDVERREIIRRILTDFALDLDDFGGWAAFPEARAALEELVAAGIARVFEAGLEVTQAGRPFARLCAQAFDAYAGRSAARHSKAV